MQYKNFTMLKQNFIILNTFKNGKFYISDAAYFYCSSDKMRPSGEGNGIPPQHTCLEYSMKRQNDMTLKNELPRSVGIQHATREEWSNRSKKNKECEPKWKK